MVEFKDPTNRVHETLFNMSSCADTTKLISPEDVDKIPWEGSVIKFFTEHAYANLPEALAFIMDTYGVGFCCATCMLKKGNLYWSTGRVGDGEDDQIKRLSSIRGNVGHLEQLLCAALAFLYQNGGYTSGIEEDDNNDTLVLYDGPNNIQLFFKFQGQRVCLQIMSECPWEGGEHKPCVYLIRPSQWICQL